MRIAISAALACALLLTGCSSRPREFRPMLAAPQPGQAAFDQAAFDRAYAECSQLFVAGKLDREGRLASAGGGAAAAGTTAAVGTGAAVAIAGYSGLAVLSATVVLLPFAAIGGAVGMARAKRAKKEKAIKAAMTGCLAERGYRVQSWERVPKVKAPSPA
jgi:hypothetical protein